MFKPYTNEESLILLRSDSESSRANLLSVRTYDVMITYDKFYQTPAIWLLGYDEVCTYSV